MAWTLPCSAVSLLLAAAALMLGGSARRVGHTLEVALAARWQQAPRCAVRLPFLAITFGHVIIGQCHEALATLRARWRTMPLTRRPRHVLDPETRAADSAVQIDARGRWGRRLDAVAPHWEFHLMLGHLRVAESKCSTVLSESAPNETSMLGFAASLETTCSRRVRPRLPAPRSRQADARAPRRPCWPPPGVGNDDDAHESRRASTGLAALGAPAVQPVLSFMPATLPERIRSRTVLTEASTVATPRLAAVETIR